VTLLAAEIDALAGTDPVRAGDLHHLRDAAMRLTGAHGRVTPELQQALFAAEDALGPRFDAGADRAFQTLVATVGGKRKRGIVVPEIRVPYWLKDDPPPAGHLVGFRSSERLPERADLVILGAGLTGASVAKNLIPEVQRGKRVVVLEMGDRPACAASGRNGGNIEMLKESFLEDYRGFVEVQKDFLRHRFLGLREDVVDARALEQARCLLRFFQANVLEIRSTMAEYGIDADVSMTGWLRIAETPEEEAGLLAEVDFARGLGVEFEVWGPEKIEAETGIRSDRKGRFIAESGNYHPFKFVHGVLRRAIDEGVLLFTGTRVTHIDRGQGGDVIVHTDRGVLEAARVIVATNAYTPEVLAGTGFIEPRVSHICNFSHVESAWQGRTITRKQGDWYANFPRQDWYDDPAGVRRGTLHVGGGLDTPIAPETLHDPPFIEAVYHQLREDTAAMVPGTRDQPPLRAWSGVMGFTADRAPVVSFFHERWDGPPDRRVVLAAAFNGYGGSQCAIAGKVAAHLAVHGAPPPDVELPDDVFSMRRFLTDRPLFDAAHPSAPIPPGTR
jgi:glycine/D-amino acid oxidase-like deaminating enzyme